MLLQMFHENQRLTARMARLEATNADLQSQLAVAHALASEPQSSSAAGPGVAGNGHSAASTDAPIERPAHEDGEPPAHTNASDPAALLTPREVRLGCESQVSQDFLAAELLRRRLQSAPSPEIGAAGPGIVTSTLPQLPRQPVAGQPASRRMAATGVPRQVPSSHAAPPATVPSVAPAPSAVPAVSTPVAQASAAPPRDVDMFAPEMQATLLALNGGTPPRRRSSVASSTDAAVTPRVHDVQDTAPSPAMALVRNLLATLDHVDLESGASDKATAGAPADASDGL